MSAHIAEAARSDASPIATFSSCHAGIVTGLAVFAGLPELVDAAARSRKIAADVLSLFEGAVLEHHREEEAELFPAVLRSAAPGAERTRVAEISERLVLEHRMIESLWSRIKPSVKAAVAGRAAAMDGFEVARLVQTYAAHAHFEETELLPLAQEILGRDGNHMAALGLSLHMRHAPRRMGYI
jgi:hypothetical protein